MKKLLLSSAVMFFLCTVSFAQQQQQVNTSKQKKGVLVTLAQQAELDQKKVRDYEAQKSLTPLQQTSIEAKKMNAQKLMKERNLALKNAQKAELVSSSNPRK